MYNYEENNMGLISEILPCLFMGGSSDIIIKSHEKLQNRAPKYNLVITHYDLAQKYHSKVKEIRLCYPDSSINYIDTKKLTKTVSQAYNTWSRGGKVLVRCQAGLNRSGLTVALILLRAGYKASDAINLIRMRRSYNALNNEEYVLFIESQ